METLRELSVKKDFINSPYPWKIRLLARNFSKILKSQGYNVEPERSTSWQRFEEFPVQKQEAIYTSFSTYYDVVVQTFRENKEIKDLQLIKKYMTMLGLRDNGDLFNRIRSSEILEIYNTSFVQTFRNFEFFRFCSYTLADVLEYEWYELYRRPHTVTNYILQNFSTVFKEQTRETVILDNSSHLIEEIFSEDKKQAIISHKILVPLLDKNNEVAAVFINAEGEPFDSKRDLKSTVVPLSR